MTHELREKVLNITRVCAEPCKAGSDGYPSDCPCRVNADAAIAVVLEEAARIAERYVIDEKELHPDVPFAQINLSYKTAVHAGAQYIAIAIRALAGKP